MKRKVIVFFTLLCTLLISLFGFACRPETEKDSKVTLIVKDGYYAVYCEESNGTDKLLDAMKDLQAEGKYTFEISGGMVVSIGGVANAVDFSKCWMLYTSDSELSNAEWGVLEYAGESYGSAVVGAEALPIKTGEYYVWAYIEF